MATSTKYSGKPNMVAVFCRFEVKRSDNLKILEECEEFVLMSTNCLCKSMVQEAMHSRHYDQDFVSSNAVGYIQIRNWRRLPLELVVEDPKSTIADVIAEISNAITFIIELKTDHYPSLSPDEIKSIIQMPIRLLPSDINTSIIIDFFLNSNCPLTKDSLSQILSYVSNYGNNTNTEDQLQITRILNIKDQLEFDRWYSHMLSTDPMFISRFVYANTSNNADFSNDSLTKTAPNAHNQKASSCDALPFLLNNVDNNEHLAGKLCLAGINNLLFNQGKKNLPSNYFTDNNSRLSHSQSNSLQNHVTNAATLKSFSEQLNNTVSLNLSNVELDIETKSATITNQAANLSNYSLSSINEVAPFSHNNFTVHTPSKGPRLRTTFSAEHEIPQLLAWFRENRNPSRQQLLAYRDQLNALPSRVTKTKPLEYHNVCNWFKNARASIRRRRMDGLESGGDQLMFGFREHCSGQNDKLKANSDLQDLPGDIDDVPCELFQEDDNFSEDELDKHGPFSHLVDGNFSATSPDMEVNNDSYFKTHDLYDNAFTVKEEVDLNLSNRRIKMTSPTNITNLNLESSFSIFPQYRKDSDHTDCNHNPEKFVSFREKLINNTTNNSKLLTCSSKNSALLEDCNSDKIVSADDNCQMECSKDYNINELCSQEDSQGLEHVSSFASDKVSSNNRVMMLARWKRSRVFIDPGSEIPLLEKWYQQCSRPSNDILLMYCKELNARPFRQRYTPLKLRNVQLWFKNHRSKLKRLMSCGVYNNNDI